MSHTGNIIYDNVNVEDDLGTILGTNSGDVETNFLEGNIMPFAKYKPIAYNAIAYVGPLVRQNENYGLSIPECVTAQGVITQYASLTELNGWSYTRPTGAAGQLFRTRDFLPVTEAGVIQEGVNGYNGDARNPFGNFNVTPTVISRSGGTMKAENAWTVPSSGGWDDSQLAISDFGTILTDKYYGFLVVPDSSSYAWWIFTDEHPVTESSAGVALDRCYERLSLEIDATDRFNATPTYTVYPILCSKGGVASTFLYSRLNTSFTSLFGEGVTAIPIPYATPIEVTFVDNNISINIKSVKAIASIDGTSYSITVRFTITNNSAYAYEFNGDKIMIRLSTGEYNESTIVSGYGESSTSIANLVSGLTLAAGETSSTYFFTKSGVTNQSLQRVWVGVIGENQSTGSIVTYTAYTDGIIYPAINELETNLEEVE